jgi:ribbon-helix-helix CopG family protein
MNKPVFVRGHAPEAIGPLIQSAPVSAVRLPKDLTAEIDAWANNQEISRSEAIRRLVEIGLRSKK